MTATAAETQMGDEKVSWLKNKDMTTDWVSEKLDHWSDLVARIKVAEPKVLEVGSWEGASVLAWLNLIPGSHVTALDKWWQVPDRESRFDKNIAPFGDRVRKMKGHSAASLSQLLSEGKTFDLIYIDGDHHREGTLEDTALAWPMLKPGGILIWDDYRWEPSRSASDRPQEAIDWFLAAHKLELDEIYRDYQIAVQKRINTPSFEVVHASVTKSAKPNPPTKRNDVSISLAQKTGSTDAEQSFHARMTERGYPQPESSFYEPWFAGKEFTSNWVSWKLGMWQTLAARIKKKNPKILEVGSWEGRSAITWLNLIPGSHITCIDHWNRMPDHERRFTSNLAEYGARVRKIVAPSRDGLETLLAERRTYDLIYIDGDHTRDATLRDSTLAWPMLRRGGVFLWDDYLWETHLPLKERPAEAIDWFIADRKNEIEIVHSGFQVAGIKQVRPILVDARPMRIFIDRIKQKFIRTGRP